MSEKLPIATLLERLRTESYTGELRLQLHQGRPVIAELPKAPTRIVLDTYEPRDAH